MRGTKKGKQFLIGFIIVGLFYFQAAIAQDGYHITFSVKHIPDSACFLVRYTGDKTYLVDTARVMDHTFTFDGSTGLEKGMYMVAGQSKNKYIDFIVNDASRFRIETDTTDWIGRIRIRGSKENQLFFDYISYLQQKRKQVDSLNHLVSGDTSGSQPSIFIAEQIKSIDREVTSHQKELANLHRDTFFGVFLLASLEPDVWNKVKQEQDPSERARLLREYKNLYWDHFDLTDERLLHTPLFHPRMEQYMDDLVHPSVDSIAREIDSLLSQVSASKPVYEYLVWYFTLKYEPSKIMGYDAVFVHMANRYFKTGRADFINETVRQNVIKRSNILEPLLIGKTAPLMILLDTSEMPVSLYQIEKAYTIIYFWDTDCSFCRKESPRLKQFYDASKDSLNLEVYAVCIDTSLTDWKKTINEHGFDWINVNGYLSLTPDFHDLYDVHSSPVMYLLDRRKTIIAKNILTDQIIEILNQK